MPHYNPNQPRVPKGRSDGGEWTRGAQGATDFSARGGSRLRAAVGAQQSAPKPPLTVRPSQPTLPGQPAAPGRPFVPGPSVAPWFPPADPNIETSNEDPEQELIRSIVKSVDDNLLWAYDAVVELHRKKRIQGALDAFARISKANTPDSHAILEFRAREYSKRMGVLWDYYDMRTAKRREIEDVCTRLKDVQAFADKGADLARKQGLSGAKFGNAVHLYVEAQVKAENDEKFTAERSYFLREVYGPQEKPIKDPEGLFIPRRVDDPQSKKAERGAIRTDVYQRVDEKTVCFFDVKTGFHGMDNARFRQVFRAVAGKHRAPRLIIIEVRPEGQRFEGGRYRP